MNTTLRALVNQAERLVRTEAYEEAIALCHAILRRYPRYARCYRILGEAYLGLAAHSEAAGLFRRALGVDPEDPIAYAGLGIIFQERGLLEEAIWQLERAFELAPGKDGLRRELGRLYQERGSPAKVRLTRAALARLYARGGLWNKAIGELNDLLAREPYRLDLRVTLARTLWRARRREEAAAAAQTILDQAPNCLVGRLILGTYWSQEGRDDEARALLQGAQELDPENREAARLLGSESLLPPRVAHLEADVLVPPAEPGEDEEADLWPRLAQPRAGAPGEVGEAGDDGEHIVALPAETIQAMVGHLAASEERAPAEDEPDPSAPPQPAAEAAEEAARGDEQWPAPAGSDAAGLAEAPVEDPPTALLSPMAILRRRLDADPADHQARLGLARLLAEKEDLAEALLLYDALVSSAPGYLDVMLADLEAIAETDTQTRALRELMGDAYARAGRLKEAMEMYRWLLAHDNSNDVAGG